MQAHHTLAALMLSVLMLMGCNAEADEPESDETFGEEVEESVDEAADDTEEAVDEAGDEMEEEF